VKKKAAKKHRPSRGTARRDRIIDQAWRINYMANKNGSGDICLLHKITVSLALGKGIMAEK
jgi:hypothetical protein